MLTLLAWGVWGVLSRLLGERLSPIQTQALSTLGILPIVVMLAIGRFKERRGQSPGDRRGIALAFGSGVVSCVGNVFFFQLLAGEAKAAAAISLTSLSPLVTTLLAIPLLGERLNRIQGLGIAVALIAFYFFNRGDGEWTVSPWLVGALMPMGLWGLAGLLQKMATLWISGSRSAFWFLIAFVPCGMAMVVEAPIRKPIEPALIWLAIGLGFTLGLGNLTILLAFASGGKASIISPMAGLYPLVSLPLAIFWLHESLDQGELLGIACAAVAVVCLGMESPSIPGETIEGRHGSEP